MTDIECTWTPSFVIARIVSEDGLRWMHEYVQGWNTAPLHENRDTFHVDHRYIADIVLGARADGLTVETTN
jgi:hypothetical protein